jgi:hypothetical protein
MRGDILASGGRSATFSMQAKLSQAEWDERVGKRPEVKVTKKNVTKRPSRKSS